MARGSAQLKPSYPLRLPVAVCAVVALSLWGSFEFYETSDQFNQKYHDPYQVMAQPDRFREVISKVPPSAVIGYLSDLPRGDLAASASVLAASYALAPRLLADSPHPAGGDWVVGNFAKTPDYATVGKQHRLIFVEDLDNGVALFRQEGQ